MSENESISFIRDKYTTTDVEIISKLIHIHEYEHYGFGSNEVSIRLEDWEKFKEFVDNQIKLLDKH